MSECSCGHSKNAHGPNGGGYCRGTLRPSKAEGLGNRPCRCESFDERAAKAIPERQRWLLDYLAQQPVAVIQPLPTDAPPLDMRNMRGLERRGWARERVPGIWEITDSGRAARG